MTDMKRVTISIPDDMDAKILEMRKMDKFVRMSYSEIVRILITAALECQKNKRLQGGEDTHV